MKPYPPLGLLYLSAYLKRAGFSVEVFDSTFARARRARAALRGRARRRGRHLHQPHDAPIGAATSCAPRSCIAGRSCSAARRAPTTSPNTSTPAPTSSSSAKARSRSPSCCARCRNAGAHRLHGRARHRVSRRRRRASCARPSAPRSRTSTRCPCPIARRSITGLYLDAWKTHHGASSINLITARGCPYNCNWCSHAVYGFTHRRRSPAQRGRRGAVDRRALRPRPGLVRRRRLHHQPSLARQLHRGAQAPRHPPSLRNHHARRPPAERRRRRAAARARLLSHLDRLGERQPEDPRRHAARRQRRAGAPRLPRSRTRTASRSACSSCGATRARRSRTSPPPSSTSRQSNPDVFFTTVSYPIKGTGYFDKVRDRVELPIAWAEALRSRLRDRRPPRQGLLQARRRMAAQRGRGLPR